MKHIRTVSNVHISSAQMSSTQIVTLVVSILSALAGILTTVVPLVEGKEK